MEGLLQSLDAQSVLLQAAYVRQGNRPAGTTAASSSRPHAMRLPLASAGDRAHQLTPERGWEDGSSSRRSSSSSNNNNYKTGNRGVRTTTTALHVGVLGALATPTSTAAAAADVGVVNVEQERESRNHRLAELSKRLDAQKARIQLLTTPQQVKGEEDAFVSSSSSSRSSSSRSSTALGGGDIRAAATQLVGAGSASAATRTATTTTSVFV